MFEPKIIYENKDFLAIDKPAGLMVHPARHRDRGEETEETLVDWLLKNRPEVATVGDDPTMRPGIVHRLDKDTSGIMLVAKTQASFEYLKLLFQKHEIQKTYYAVVRGVPKNKEGIIDAPIGIRNGTLKRSVRSKKMRKDAVTEYKVLKSYEGGGKELGGKELGSRSLLEVHPKTGRTHQIRVHLASIGHPIIGDRLYGPKKATKDESTGRLMLHAVAIEFHEKGGSVIRLESKLSTSSFLRAGR